MFVGFLFLTTTTVVLLLQMVDPVVLVGDFNCILDEENTVLSTGQWFSFSVGPIIVGSRCVSLFVAFFAC